MRSSPLPFIFLYKKIRTTYGRSVPTGLLIATSHSSSAATRVPCSTRFARYAAALARCARELLENSLFEIRRETINRWEEPFQGKFQLSV